eukprot:TRINITY_DN32839_c0_g1_i1.p1 TRINITY_DN32839_c0_g1~~TRINITY_DN32839_c0_g1_i1.p1  ORF type:complete len:234 (+),score=10.27 TRINITY_DN32839_c0_g1_i1:53-754(+)
MTPLLTPLDKVIASATGSTTSLQLLRSELNGFGNPCWNYNELRRTNISNNLLPHQPRKRKKKLREEFVSPGKKPIMKLVSESVVKDIPIVERCRVAAVVSSPQVVSLPEITNNQTRNSFFSEKLVSQRYQFSNPSRGRDLSGGRLPVMLEPSPPPQPPQPPPKPPTAKRFRGVHHVMPLRTTHPAVLESESLKFEVSLQSASPTSPKPPRQNPRRPPGLFKMKKGYFAPLIKC